MYDDFLEIFKHPFHKCRLKGVRNMGRFKSREGRKYWKFLGEFEFTPPKSTPCEVLDAMRVLLTEWLNSLPEESNCFTRKFTRRVVRDGKPVKKVSFTYVFDIVPKNIRGFRIDDETGRMRLYVVGYGMA